MIEEVKSRENRAFVETLKIFKLKKFRDLLGKFPAEGTRFCEELLKCNIKIENLFFTENSYNKNKNLIDDLLKKSKHSYKITQNLIKNISNTNSPQEILCTCEKSKNCANTLEELIFKEKGKILVLENVQNPLNLGTILRTADSLGIKRIVLNKNCCEIYNPKVLSGSMGSIFRLHFYFSDDLKDTVLKLRKNFKIDVFSTTLCDDSLSLEKIKFPVNCAVIIGNEGNGVTQNVINASNFKVKIPMSASVNSLNVSIAAGIIMWELQKSTRF